IDRRDFLADSLIGLLPPMNMTLNALPGNVINSYLQSSGMSFKNLELKARTDSILHARAQVLGLTSGESLRVDTLSLELLSRGKALLLDVDIDNRPGTLDEFAHVCLRGGIAGNTGRFFIEQRNIQGQTGYRLGLHASMADSVATVNFDPVEPTIAYKQWTINKDNFLAFNPYTYHLDANLDARGAGSRLQLLSTDAAEGDSVNNIALKVSDVHIQDWLNLNPFAPPIAGDINADLTLQYTARSVNGSGTLGVQNLSYGRQKMGNIGMDLDVNTDFGGAIWANAGLNINDRRALLLNGALNDTTMLTPLTLTAQLTDFPLTLANPFLPRDYAQLSGSLNGYMEVDGTLNHPVANGSLGFRNATVKVGMMGTTFRFDSTAIAVDSNLVVFNDFSIFGANNNPLKVKGTVDMRNFASPGINLSLQAANMQFLDSKKGNHVNLYGRGFLDLDAKVRGSLSLLAVDAKLAILSATNLTYQLAGASAAAVGLQEDNDVVKFVNFADTGQMAVADTVVQQSMAMVLNASVDIRQGSQFTVDLSTDGQNRAQLRPQGILSYSMNPSQPDGRLTGRLVIDGGFFRYSLPVISEKTFNFTPGSYVAFNGPVMNPTLNISAVDQTRANVTRPGENSRLVNFDVTLMAKGTPEHLDVSFDLSTTDDLSLQNELQAMSPTQRANKAMNLLLYGLYSSGETSATANLSGNALYGFLSSQLNKWAANTIKGVDVSFGFDQFDRTRNGQTSTTTQYSYKVSKSLFNDRFKIIVGGNYSTDTEDSDIAENLISDVSLEYMLNQSGSMYVRLFRHTGYESILEGEVTQTGVGFVIKRRVNRVADIFNFRKAVKQ
ncbi:MAG: translocation/assembly module TamB, partial [Muribaculaceae bacterium]|nr:translocation/assembly module TamB [Muribaculaceae bacterium]